MPLQGVNTWVIGLTGRSALCYIIFAFQAKSPPVLGEVRFSVGWLLFKQTFLTINLFANFLQKYFYKTVISGRNNVPELTMVKLPA